MMSTTDTSYNCGSCGYSLNLVSNSNQITSGIGSNSKHKKSIKKGYTPFASIDLSRFTQVDKINCLPISCGVYGSKTKLLCRKCGADIGYGYGGVPLCGFEPPNSTAPSCKKFMVKIDALKPSDQESGQD
ncbi:uncharacterized protein At4g08330, chloroplastic-like [Impatiens glandulifera]|uniref:uncharacterized protein At4g08330, chloroplastic-like n=1 Tax=Impatiens glandulifera TaxID=253017 RepID=UPI001FB0D615|nr:uncharacterized protein At4g08330, chloroplastic-like [Impatiens glandulifera]